MTKSHNVESIPFALTDTDRENLAGGDDNFQPHTWAELKQIIGGRCMSCSSALFLTLFPYCSCQ